MILLRTGRTDEAIEIFQRGVHSAVPFKRRAFENALALAMLKRGEYTQAIADAKATELKTERTSEGKAGRLLVLHALAGLKTTFRRSRHLLATFRRNLHLPISSPFANEIASRALDFNLNHLSTINNGCSIKSAKRS